MEPLAILCAVLIAVLSLGGCASAPEVKRHAEAQSGMRPVPVVNRSKKGKADSRTVSETKGRREAQKDIRAGKLAERIYGLAFPHDPIYQQILRDRFGIQLERVAMCAVDDNFAIQTASYNYTMRAEIDRRFGIDALEKTMEEARRMWKDSHPNEE